MQRMIYSSLEVSFVSNDSLSQSIKISFPEMRRELEGVGNTRILNENKVLVQQKKCKIEALFSDHRIIWRRKAGWDESTWRLEHEGMMLQTSFPLFQFFIVSFFLSLFFYENICLLLLRRYINQHYSPFPADL